MRSEDPLDLLAIVSGLLEATDPRRLDPFARAGDDTENAPTPSIGDLVESLIGTAYAETTAALTALRALTPDELLAARIGRELASRKHPMPPWLHGLNQARLELDVWFLTHVLGDGDDYLFGVTLPSGHALSALVYVDHNMGTVVKDAFVVPEDLEFFAETVRGTLQDPDQSLTRTDPAVARAAVEAAIDDGAHVYPPLESESWPMCRPLVEWMLRMLPSGGAAPQRVQWSEEERAALQADFFASPHGAPLDDSDHRGLLESLVWFGADYSTGDPLRWSPVAVQILLLDWLPRKVIAEAAYLTKVPDLLRAFVRYSHQKHVIRAEHTTVTLAAVDEYEPEYQRLIRSERPQGPAALLAEMFQSRLAEDEFDDLTTGEIFLEGLDRAVGDRITLMNLDAEALPDEQFEWAGVPDDIRPRVQDVLDACDRCCAEVLDVEHRTAMRRFLSRAAVGDPAIFRRKASALRGAAAVAWVICRANNSAGNDDGMQLEVKELLAWFGVKGSASQRAEPLLRANGIDPHTLYGSMDLGAPDLLTAKRRTQILSARDGWLNE